MTVTNGRVPHIRLSVLWQKWDSTALDRPFFYCNGLLRSMVSTAPRIISGRGPPNPNRPNTLRRIWGTRHLLRVQRGELTQLSLRKAAYVAAFALRSVRRNPPHSVRKAWTGLMDAARWAGITLATNAQNPRAAMEPASTSGSQLFTW